MPVPVRSIRPNGEHDHRMRLRLNHPAIDYDDDEDGPSSLPEFPLLRTCMLRAVRAMYFARVVIRIGQRGYLVIRNQMARDDF
jgi:hypothetical protein